MTNYLRESYFLNKTIFEKFVKRSAFFFKKSTYFLKFRIFNIRKYFKKKNTNWRIILENHIFWIKQFLKSLWKECIFFQENHLLFKVSNIQYREIFREEKYELTNYLRESYFLNKTIFKKFVKRSAFFFKKSIYFLKFRIFNIGEYFEKKW